MSFLVDTQKAIITKLEGDATLGGLVRFPGRDWPPADMVFPSIYIGGDNTDYGEDKDNPIITYHADFEIYSEYKGHYEVKKIADRIIDLFEGSEITMPAGATARVLSVGEFENFITVQEDWGQRAIIQHGTLTVKFFIDY